MPAPRSATLSRLSIAIGVLALAAAPRTGNAGANSGPSMLTTASNASLPTAQRNLGMPTTVNVTGNGTTDDWATIQAAIDAASPGTVLLVPARPSGIRISQALRLRSNVTLQFADRNQKITCSGDAGGALGQWPFYGCLMASGVENNVWLTLPVIPVNDPAVGDTVLTFTSGNYTTLAPVVGDLLSVESTTSFTVTPGVDTPPTQSNHVYVTAVDGTAHTVTVTPPIEVTQTGTQVRKLTNAGVDVLNSSGADSGVPMWDSYRASVIGGNWTATGGGGLPGFMPDGGVETHIDIASFTGGHFYGNFCHNCRIAAERLFLGVGGPEIAFNSAGTTVAVGTVDITGTTVGTARILGINEGSRGNTLDVGTLNLGATNPVDAVQIDKAYSNRVRVGAINGGVLSQYTVHLSSGDPAGTPPDVKDNVVEIASDNIPTVSQYIALDGAYNAASATVSAAGSGYLTGDVVTDGVTGGSCSLPPTWTVTASGGLITSVAVANPGKCKTRPTNPVSLSGGSGSGGTLSVTYAGGVYMRNNLVRSTDHGTTTNGGGSGAQLLGVGPGNWVESWMDHGTITQDGPSSTLSGFRNYHDANGYRLSNQGISDPILPNFTVNSATLAKTDTTLTAVPGLAIALTAGKTYSCWGHLRLPSTPSAGGIKMALASGDTLTANPVSFNATAMTGATVSARSTATALGTAVGAATAAVTDVDFAGAMQVGTAGTLVVQAAQNAASGTTTIATGSTLACVRTN